MGDSVDLVVVGAGIVGLATARAHLRRHPGRSVVIVDKEAGVAAHQSSHNSGVIHAGVYYAPGSEKARLCAAGRRAMVEYCVEHGIAHAVCGKLVVATDDRELTALARLEERSKANGLAVRRLGAAELREREPHAAGVAALHVPETGIVDYADVCQALAAEVQAAGAELRLGHPVESISDTGAELAVVAGGRRLRAATLVNCAGLQSDRVARLVQDRAGQPVLDARSLPRIMAFRGEYYELVPARRHLVRHLVYPVPDPRFPFLGVHFTRDIHDGVHAGPNAVPALGREAYRWRTVVPRDVVELARARSTWRLARRYWRTEVDEVVRSLSKDRFVRSLQRLVPEVVADDLVPAPAGVRAQAVAPDGTLLDDFAFARTSRTLHVLNAPSPAATASLAIGEQIVDELASMTTPRSA
jgi:L-2-hydroxyglutarate oxidase